MTATPAVPIRPTGSARPVRPWAVTLSVALWLGAILAGVAETLVRLATPEAPAAAGLAVRFGLYLVLAVLVLALFRGHDAVRWTVAVLLGGLGTLSLVVEPIGYLAAGGSVAAFLASAGWADLAVAGLRALHIVEVLAALALLFHPSSTAFFRRS
jgi:hypothetical protein